MEKLQNKMRVDSIHGLNSLVVYGLFLLCSALLGDQTAVPRATASSHVTVESFYLQNDTLNRREGISFIQH